VFGNQQVRGSEFLRKVKKASKKHKLAYRWTPERGAGRHGTV
jgi:hypothetical protein